MIHSTMVIILEMHLVWWFLWFILLVWVFSRPGRAIWEPKFRS